MSEEWCDEGRPPGALRWIARDRENVSGDRLTAQQTLRLCGGNAVAAVRVVNGADCGDGPARQTQRHATVGGADRRAHDAMPGEGGLTLDSVLDGAGLAVLVVQDDRVVHANSQAAHVFAYDRIQDLLELERASLLLDADERDRMDGVSIGLYEGQTPPRVFEATGLRADGSRIQIEVRPALVRWGGRRALCSVITDLGTRRDRETRVISRLAELAHHERICTLGEMSAAVMHEISQPLTALSVGAGAIRRVLEGDAPNIALVRKTAGTMEEQIRRLRETAERVRSFAGGRYRTQEHNRVIDLAKVVEQAATMTRPACRKAGVVCRIVPFEGNPLMVHADPVQLGQIIVNLMKNAVDALAEAGRADGSVTVQLCRAGREAVVDVIDNGPGITAEDAERIFDRFYTTKQDGMGVGLSICRSIAENYGGSLQALCSPREGGAFRLRLPLHGGSDA